MRHVIKIVEVFEFDHDKEKLGDAVIGSNYEKARELALKALSMPKPSAAIESLMFDNTESLQTRVLSLFIAGYVRGQMRPPAISVEIIHKHPPEKNT